jgi:WD repeat-containing protein 70
MWDENQPNYRPTSIFKQAHRDSTEITSLQFFEDGQRMLSRATDDTLKFWDWRFTSEPIQVWNDLLNFSSHTNVAISPNEKIIVAGDSVKRGMGNGCLHFFNAESFEKICQIGISEANVIRCQWHAKLNQIVVTSQDSNARIFFDSEMSKRGALNCIVKESRKHQPDDIQFGNPILAPHALPQFKKIYTSAAKKLRKAEEERKEKSQKKYELGSSSSYQQYVMKMINKNTLRDEDPREALLKYNDLAEKEAFWVTPAYQKTQPNPVFNYDSLKTDPNEMGKKFCKNCGQEI